MNCSHNHLLYRVFRLNVPYKLYCDYVVILLKVCSQMKFYWTFTDGEDQIKICKVISKFICRLLLVTSIRAHDKIRRDYSTNNKQTIRIEFRIFLCFETVDVIQEFQ